MDFCFVFEMNPKAFNVDFLKGAAGAGSVLKNYKSGFFKQY